MKIKKYVLVLGSIGTIYLVALTLLSTTHFCPSNQTCTDLFMLFSPWGLASYVFFTVPLLLFSVITYRMKDEVFYAWWNSARWWVPIIIIVTLWLENAGGGGTLGMNKDFTVFILGILYTVFIVTSSVKIVRAYIKTRG